jgi:acetyl esterase/lipase
MLPACPKVLIRSFAAAAILAAALVEPVTAQSTEARPVYDASNWADVMGDLRPYWNAFKSEQQANGVTWNDTGQITSIQGARLVRATRADSVPEVAVPRIVALAREAGVLVGSSAGEAAKIRVDEAARAREAGEESSVGGGDGPFGTGDGDGDSGASDGDDGDGAGDDDSAGDGDDDSGADDVDTDGDGVADSEDDDDDGDGIPDSEDDDDDGDGIPDNEEDPAGDDPGPIDPDADSDGDLGTVGDGTDGDTGDTGDTGDGGSTGGEDIPPLDGDIPLDPGGGGEVLKDLKYGNEHARQVLDLYLPEGDGPFPVVVFFHGGAFVGGDKSQASGFSAIVDAGYAMAAANYKLLQKSSFGDVNFLEDVGEIAKAAYDARAAVRWLKDNAGEYKLDASNVGVVGASAGGYLAAAVGACGNNSQIRDESPASNTSAAVKAVVDWFGPTDFATFMQDSGQELPTGGFDVGIDTVRSVLNSNGAVSPVEFVNGGDPPHMIRHGEADTVVPIGQSESYAAALRQAGVSVDYQSWPAQGHGAPSNAAEEIGLVIDFLDTHLQ